MSVKRASTVSDAVFARWRRRAIRQKSLSKAESIEMENIIVDFVVVCLKSNLENLRKPLTFHRRIFSRFLNVMDFKMALCPKSARKSVWTRENDVNADVWENRFPFPSKTQNNLTGIDISQPTPSMSLYLS